MVFCLENSRRKVFHRGSCGYLPRRPSGEAEYPHEGRARADTGHKTVSKSTAQAGTVSEANGCRACRISDRMPGGTPAGKGVRNFILMQINF